MPSICLFPDSYSRHWHDTFELLLTSKETAKRRDMIPSDETATEHQQQKQLQQQQQQQQLCGGDKQGSIRCCSGRNMDGHLSMSPPCAGGRSKAKYSDQVPLRFEAALHGVSSSRLGKRSSRGFCTRRNRPQLRLPGAKRLQRFSGILLSHGKSHSTAKGKMAGMAYDDAVVPRCDEIVDVTGVRRNRDNAVVLAAAAAAAGGGMKRSARVCHLPDAASHLPQPTAPHPCSASDAPAAAAAETGDLHRATPGDHRSIHPLISIPVPDDPRQWSRLDVRTWLEHLRCEYNIRDLDLDRFPMNGKGLCVMSEDMFLYRVPTGGVPLYIDFQRRFRRALGIR